MSRILIALTALFAVAITESGYSQTASRTEVLQQAPTDQPAFFPSALLQSQYDRMDLNKILTVRLMEGGNYNVNIRHLTARETAMQHARIADIWVVTEGAGSIVTGGELVDPKASAQGDKTAASIRGGNSREVKVGDVIFIPPGLPHQMAEVRGKVTFLNIRFDAKTLREARRTDR